MSTVNNFVIINGVLKKYLGIDSVVVIPEGVIQIEKYVFADNSNLTEVVMPDSVKVVGNSAFSKCTKLKSVRFSNNLTTIEYAAFVDCRSLVEIVLPNTLKSIGDGSFAGCVNLSKITHTSEECQLKGNPFAWVDSYDCDKLFDKNGFLIFANTLYKYKGNDNVVIVPEGVTRIASGAFESKAFDWDNKNDLVLKKVVFPKSTKSVESSAFINCSKLKEIEFFDDVEFEGNAFINCKNLADENGFVIIKNTLYDYVGKGVIINVPSGVEVVSDRVFDSIRRYSGKDIVKVTLPDGLKRIGKRAFYECKTLEEINIPDTVEIIEDGAFFGCENLAKTKIPDKAIVHNEAFYRCKNFIDENGFIIVNDFLYQYISADADVVVPDNIRAVSDGAFYNRRIEKVKLPEHLDFLGAAFTECFWLQEIEIPDGVTCIESKTFSGCKTLKKVKLPDSIVKIDRAAFENCEALENIEIPQTVKDIESHVFTGCKSLKSLVIPNGVKLLSYSVCKDCEALESVVACGVQTVEWDSFRNCHSLSKVTLSQNMKSIQSRAFGGCKNLKDIQLQNRNCEVDADAFHNCSKLYDENGMMIVGGMLLSCISDNERVIIPDTVHTITTNVFREGVFRENRSWTSYRKEGLLHEIVIPSSVRTIMPHAFEGCRNLSKVELSQGIEEIGYRAFADCESIKTITIPESVSLIGRDAFLGCTQLSDIFVDKENACFSDIDGVLYDAEKTVLIFCPAGKKLELFTFNSNVERIEDHAFRDCFELKKVVIPKNVKQIGHEVFAQNCLSNGHSVKYIEIENGAGAEFVGTDIFGFNDGVGPLFYPKIPVLFFKERTLRVRLALGYCQQKEKYDEEYAQDYRKFAESNKKTLLKEANTLGLKKVKAYFEDVETGAKECGESVYKPNLTLKKPSELAKVEILEETVLKGTLEDLRDVLNTYKTFEMTARALGLACRYRGVDFVRELVNSKADFRYENDVSLQRKYKMNQKTVSGVYLCEYCLMLVPEKLDLKNDYEYTPMCGVSYIGITDKTETKVLPLKDRLEVLKFLAENKKARASLDEMLMWALEYGEIDFADALIDMGVNLNQTPPSYYGGRKDKFTYLDIITDAKQSVYWSFYSNCLCGLDSNLLLLVLERLDKLVKTTERKLVVTQFMFDSMKWNEKTLKFALQIIDTSKLTQKKVLEYIVSQNFVSSLDVVSGYGWLSNYKKLDNLIEYARNGSYTEALTWLMNYKNRNFDVTDQLAKEQKKMMKELTEDPNSVSALKKVWGYKKLDDGTLIITSYKGDAIDVDVPAVIGKSAVTVIGEDAFAVYDGNNRIKNRAERKKIKSITIPEGVVEIKRGAFCYLDELEKLTLPSTVKKIGTPFVSSCKELKKVNIPTDVKIVGDGILFVRCDKLHDQNGCIIINNCLYTHTERNGRAHSFGVKSDIGNLVVPENVTEIAAGVFYNARMSSLTLPNGLEVIGKNAFGECSFLREIEITGNVKIISAGAFSRCASLQMVKLANGVKSIGAKAFAYCINLRDIYIPKSVNKLGKEVFGPYDTDKLYVGKVSGICVHTQPDAPIVDYLKNYSNIKVVFDYEE